MQSIFLRTLQSTLLFLLVTVLPGQQVINNLPIRAYGTASVTPLVSVSPNLVEGREISLPLGIAIDPATGFVYVADSRNSRVLGFANYLSFTNGVAASLVIGQSDFVSTFPATPAQRADALNFPAGLAVDASGNLYVADIGNHRVVRFPRPVENWGGVGTRLQADFVVGQPNLTSNTANATNAPTASSLRFPTVATVTNLSNPASVSITFDGSGNLWVTDYDNHRVLRYPAASLGAGAANGPAADLVLGQADFTSRVVPSAATTLASLQNKTTLRFPRGIAFIPDDNLIAVADSLHRVQVYQNPSSNGQASARVLGVPTQAQITAGVQVAANTLAAPFGVFAAASNKIGVVDTGNHRVVIYPPMQGWVSEAQQFSPSATLVGGQANLGDRGANRGQGVPNNDGYFNPFAAVALQGKLFVLDTQNHRVLRQSLGDLIVEPADAVLGQTTFQANAANLVEGREVNQPYGIAFDYTSDPPRVFIADTGNNRVLGYRSIQRMRLGETADLVIGQPDLSTTVVNYPTGSANTPTQTGLYTPFGVAVDAEGNVWVADSNNGRLVRFPKPDFDSPTNMPDADIVLGQQSFTSKSSTATQNTMSFPTGIAISPITGSVVASDRNHNRVLLFSQPLSNGMTASKVIGQGSFVSSEPGAGGTRLNSPRGIALDSANRLYVADFGNNRLQIFENVDALTPQDANAGVSVTIGFGTLALSGPEGIVVDRQTGEVWLTEAGRNRVLRYPEYSSLFLDPNANFFVSTIVGGGNSAISVALDPLGFPVVGENSSRITFYVPRLSTTNGATFFTSQPGLPGVGQAATGHLAPNTIASAFSFIGNFDTSLAIPTNFATAVPLPTELSDIEITLDGRALPLFFVSAGQINFFLPNDVPQSGVVVIDVRRKSNGDLLAGDFVGMAAAAPGLFTTNQQGTGQIAAVNYAGTAPSGDNGAGNPIRNNQVIAFYGTGMGFVPGAPNDGSPVDTALSTQEKPQVGSSGGWIDGASVEYSGFAPGFVGLWQINVRIPNGLAPSNAAPLVLLYRGTGSTQGVRNGQQTTIQTTFAVQRP